ncbi:MAG: DM9 repeat-containing protein [Saprospiraceae bacterium]
MRLTKLVLLISIFLFTYNFANAQLKWVEFSEELPPYSVIGGVESNRSLPVCRCNYNGAMHPGKVVENKCNIGYGGMEKTVSNFEVLTNSGVIQLDWIKTDGSSLPKNAIKAGTEGDRTLYVGRVYHEKGTHPGKVFKVGDKYICNIGYGGEELTFTTFEVLVKYPPNKKSKALAFDKRCERLPKTAIISNSIGSIGKEKQIYEGSSLLSRNLKYQVRVTDDGRLVIEEILEHGLCNDGSIVVFKYREIWANTTQKGDASKDYFLKFQNDGNLCIYSDQSGFVWCSMSNARNGHHFEITNIGHIEVVDNHGNEVWPD